MPGLPERSIGTAIVLTRSFTKASPECLLQRIYMYRLRARDLIQASFSIWAIRCWARGTRVIRSAVRGSHALGYVVLAFFDPMGQGERIYVTPDASGHSTRRESADDEHSHPGKQMLLVGDSASRFQLWDAVRSLDYLASHPLVDPQRLASTGQSGGATLTMMLAAVDPRLAAAVVSSGNTENVACANFNPPGSTDDAEQDFIYSGPGRI